MTRRSTAMGSRKLLLLIAVSFCPWVYGQDNGFLEKPALAHQRTQALIRNMDPPDRDAVNRAFLAMTVLHQTDRGSDCGRGSLAYVRAIPEKRPDGREGVLTVCGSGIFWAARNTVLLTLASMAINIDADAPRLFEGVLVASQAQQKSYYARVELFNSAPPPCDMIKTAYLVVVGGDVTACNTMPSAEAATAYTFFGERMISRVSPFSASDAQKLKSDPSFVVQFMQFLEQAAQRVVFDQVVRHELGHIALLHHKLGPPENAAAAIARERAADTFARNKSAANDEDAWLGMLAQFALASQVQSQSQVASGLATVRLEDKYFVCMMVETIANDPKLSVLSAEMAATVNCR